LPNTVPYADAINAISRCVNLLTKVRVPLPFTMNCKRTVYGGSLSVGSDDGDELCFQGSNAAAIKQGVGEIPCNTVIRQDEWGGCCDSSDCGFNVFNSGVFIGDCGPNNEFVISGHRETVEYNFNPFDPNALYAMGDDLRDMYSLPTVGFWADYRDSLYITSLSQTDTQTDSIQCQTSVNTPSYPLWFQVDGYGWKAEASDSSFNIKTCRYFATTNGIIDPGNPVASDHSMVKRTLQGETILNCSSGTSRNIEVRPQSTTEVVISVPLID
jgi:hypothetical protein